MTSKYPFGNDPAKIEGYKAFWSREDVGRPLVGFSLVGWFPLEYFSACKSWRVDDYITPEMIDPESWLDDQERLLEEGEEIADDILRGACPTQVAVPCFLPGSLGCRIRVLPGNVMGEELKLPWEEALKVHMDHGSPWFKKYLEFAQALARKANGRYPVSHGAELGPTDLHALLRGYNESILDLVHYPVESSELLWKLGHIFTAFTEELWRQIPLFHGGYFDAQYQLWSPGTICRMQEDVTALYSPDLYRKLAQPVDRMIAGHFANSFMHLHSTSMFLLDAFLEIEEIRCFQINIEPFNIPVRDMVQYFQRVQEAERPLLIRGSFKEEELRILLGSLEPRGLYLHIMVKDMAEIEALRPLLGM